MFNNEDTIYGSRFNLEKVLVSPELAAIKYLGHERTNERHSNK